jgi:putative aminopeptidase FrvX
MNNYNELFDTIEELVLHHSPSGFENEIDQLLLAKLREIGVENWQDQAGNIIAKIKGKNSDSSIAITAHKDEIGAIVKAINFDGSLQIRKLGGAFPWVYGEGVVDILGDQETISGILSFGSRHVSHESPQKLQQENKPLLWEDSWVVTKLSLKELEVAGVRVGSRVVIGKHRKKPIRIKDFIGSYTLDNKASLAILLELAKQIENPEIDVYLVASAKEEVGAIGALYFTQNHTLDALIALEICPISSEYPLEMGEKPVLLSQDGYGIYDEGLNGEIIEAANRANCEIQLGVISGFGSDASIAMKFGHVCRAACLSFPTENTHGFEIAHLGAISNCTKILLEWIDNYQLTINN